MRASVIVNDGLAIISHKCQFILSNRQNIMNNEMRASAHWAGAACAVQRARDGEKAFRREVSCIKWLWKIVHTLCASIKSHFNCFVCVPTVGKTVFTAFFCPTNAGHVGLHKHSPQTVRTVRCSVARVGCSHAQRCRMNTNNCFSA